MAPYLLAAVEREIQHQAPRRWCRAFFQGLPEQYFAAVLDLHAVVARQGTGGFDEVCGPPIAASDRRWGVDILRRINLVERYFPHASHQVMLVTTDEEIDQRYLERIRGAVGHSYRIEYDDRTQSSRI